MLGTFFLTLFKDQEFKQSLIKKWNTEKSAQNRENYLIALKTFGFDVLGWFWEILWQIDTDIEPCNIIHTVSGSGFQAIIFDISKQMLSTEKWSIFKNKATIFLKKYDRNVKFVKIEVYDTKMVVSWLFKSEDDKK